MPVFQIPVSELRDKKQLKDSIDQLIENVDQKLSATVTFDEPTDDIKSDDSKLVIQGDLPAIWSILKPYKNAPNLTIIDNAPAILGRAWVIISPN